MELNVEFFGGWGKIFDSTFETFWEWIKIFDGYSFFQFFVSNVYVDIFRTAVCFLEGEIQTSREKGCPGASRLLQRPRAVSGTEEAFCKYLWGDWLVVAVSLSLGISGKPFCLLRPHGAVTAVPWQREVTPKSGQLAPADCMPRPPIVAVQISGDLSKTLGDRPSGSGLTKKK